MLRFDVFGHRVAVTREGDGWRAVLLGTDGKHRDAPGLVIPPWIEEKDLGRFLADLLHEAASPEQPQARSLDGADSAEKSSPGS